MACGGKENPAISTPTATPSVASPSPSPTNSLPASCIDQSQFDTPFILTTQDNFFIPDCLVVKNTQAATLKNGGSNVHNWTIEGTQVDIDIQPGETKNLEAVGDAVAPGTYGFFCKYHRSIGMTGTIVIGAA